MEVLETGTLFEGWIVVDWRVPCVFSLVMDLVGSHRVGWWCFGEEIGDVDLVFQFNRGTPYFGEVKET